jgi:plasmid stabilization system protein ParE
MAQVLGCTRRIAVSKAGAALIEVVWSATALGHLQLIRAYIEQFNPRAARTAAESLLTAGNSLQHFPAARQDRARQRPPGTGHGLSLHHSVSRRRQRRSHPANSPHVPPIPETILWHRCFLRLAHFNPGGGHEQNGPCHTTRAASSAFTSSQRTAGPCPARSSPRGARVPGAAPTVSAVPRR